MTPPEPPALARRAAALLRTTATGWHAPPFGLSAAERLAVTFSDGTAAFAKAATTEETGRWLRHEHHVLADLPVADLAPQVLGWEDDGEDHPLLLTADLSAAYWPAAGAEDPRGGTSTVWRPGDIDAVLDALTRLRGVPPPADLPRTSSWPEPQWPHVIPLADQLVEAGVVAPGWLEAHATTLIAADSDADALDLGTTVVHGDVRSDNLCLLGDVTAREVRLVDWSHAGIGHERHDLVQLLPTLALEGGPRPETVCPGPAPLVARLAGPSLRRACVSEQPAWLRRVFVGLASINLTWLATILELPPPVPQPPG